MAVMTLSFNDFLVWTRRLAGRPFHAGQAPADLGRLSDHDIEDLNLPFDVKNRVLRSRNDEKIRKRMW
jgi:hypothetical protein